MGDLLATLANWAQIISIPLTIIAIFLSIWLYRRSRQRRAISCIFDPLVSPVEIKAGDALRGEIEIRYRGQPVDNLFIVRATLRNTGNLPIRDTDIVEPLTFTFGHEAELVRQPQIVNKKPDNLKAVWELPVVETPTAKVTVAQLGFELFNPGEELTTEFLCTGESSTPSLIARIEGITQIDVVDSQEIRWRNEIKAACIVGGIGFFVLVLLLTLSPLAFGQGKGSPFQVLLAGFLAGVTASLLQGASPLIKLIKYRRSKSLRG